MSRRFQQYSSSEEPVPGYRLVRFLGKGNFGEVWMATAPGNKKVALKIIDVRGREGLLESRAIERVKDINHAHLVSIFAYWLVNDDGQIVDDTAISKLAAVPPAGKDVAKAIRGTMYFDPNGQESQPVALIVAMTLGSKNLSDLLEEYRNQGRNGIPVDVLLDLTEDAAKGLDYLNAPVHDQGEGPKPIIHGDIKPQNLLIVGDSLQICDFGLAREVDNLRKTATAMGTYAYAAPELLAGHPHVRSDQYCLAVSYIELRSGALPLFGLTNPLEIAELHRDGKLDLSGLGHHEAEVIRKATDPDPEKRWTSCRDMIRALRTGVDFDNAGGQAPQGSAVPAIQHDLTGTMPLGTVADTVRSKQKASGGKRTLRFVSRAVMALLATAILAGGGWWGLSLFGPKKDSPEWFAGQFSILAGSLPNQQDRSTEALQRVLDARKKVASLEERWSQRIQEEVGQSHFAAAARLVAAASNEAELMPADKVREQWDRVARPWTEIEEKLIEAQDFTAASAVINEFLPESVFPPGPEKYGKFASRQKVIDWQKPLCDEESTRLASEIGRYLEASPGIGRLMERARSIDGIASLPQAAKAAFRDTVKTRAIALVKKLSDSGDHDFPEALRQLSQVPPAILPEGENAAVKGQLRDSWLAKLRELGKSNPDAQQDLVAELNSLLKAFPDSAAAKSLLQDWTKPDTPQPGENTGKSNVVAPPAAPPVLPLIQAARLAFIKENNFAEARKKLADATALLKATPNNSLARQVRTWEAAIALSDPGSLPAERAAAIAVAKELLDRPNAFVTETADAASRLALAFARFLPGSDSASTDEQMAWALQAVRAARGGKCDPQTKAALATSCAALWERRIERFVRSGEPPPPTREEFRTFEDDWGKLDAEARQGRRLALINAWRGECQHCLEPDTPLDAAALFGQLPPDPGPYVRYVRLLIGANDSSDPQATIAELTALFSDSAAAGDKAPEVFRTPSRMKRVVEWSVNAVSSFCEQRAAPGLLANPFGDAGQAQRCYKLLKAVRQSMAGIAPAQRQWTADVERRLLVHLAAAATFEDPPDLPTARELTSAWIDAPAGGAAVKGADAEVMLYAAVRGRLPPSVDVPAGSDDGDLVKASTRLIHALADHVRRRNFGRIDKEAAKTICGNFLQPVLQRTDVLRRRKLQAEQRRELGDFYVAAYDFVAEHRSTAWPIPKPSAWIDDVLNAAIELKDATQPPGGSREPSAPVADAELRRLYCDRAQRRLERDNSDLDGAIADASRGGASDLMADALGRRAPLRDTRELLLKDVNAAVAEGEKAKSAYGLTSLSVAYVLRANYDNDPAYTFEAREKDLAAAIAAIQQADKVLLREQEALQGAGLRGLGLYLYHLAAGNAYEDLAWLVEKDPSTNMNMAISQFGKAARANPLESQPHCSIGRCYYKALAESFLPADALKKQNGTPLHDEFEVMDECEHALKEALDEDPRMVEANDYLARLYQYRAAAYFGLHQDDPNDQDSLTKSKQWCGKAEAQCKATWDLAQEQGLRHRAFYAVNWVMFPLSDYRFDADKALGPQRRRAAVLARLELLDKVPPPPGRVQEPHKVQAWIRGYLAETEGKQEDALRIYSDALPQDLGAATCADTALLVARAACRLKIAMKTVRAAAEATGGPAEKAIQEAEGAVDDASAARRVAFFINDKANALEQAFLAHTFLYFTAASPERRSPEKRTAMYARSMEDVTGLLKLAPRRPNEFSWCASVARILRTEMQQADPARAPTAAQRLKEYSDIIAWASRAVDLCKRKQGRDTLRTSLLRPCTEAAVKFANDQLATTPPPGPLLRADLEKKRDEWKQILDTLL